MVWIETPTNPLLTVADISAISSLAARRGGITVVDNTFATPYLQQPLTLGADVVLHSTTKYLGGHSDVVGGFLATNDDALAEQLGFVQNAAGAVPSPFDCYMLQRGIKTLAVRMDRHCDNAQQVVDMLVNHSGVESVLFPGLAGHRGHDVATKQMSRYGAMVSFIPTGDVARARQIVESTRLFTLAESLGAVESLIELPAAMTHASVADSDLAVDPRLIRLSVGIESIVDLLADLRSAIDQ
jgi:cystathionine gamma-synthase